MMELAGFWWEKLDKSTLRLWVFSSGFSGMGFLCWRAGVVDLVGESTDVD